MTQSPAFVELPFRYDLTLYLNGDLRFEYYMLLEDETPIDNTAYRIDMEVRRAPGAALLAAYTSVNGRITLGGANGKVSVWVPHSEITPVYREEQYRYDILQTDVTGARDPIFYGTLTAVAMITQGLSS